jgi:hypothetical protein
LTRQTDPAAHNRRAHEVHAFILECSQQVEPPRFCFLAMTKRTATLLAVTGRKFPRKVLARKALNANSVGVFFRAAILPAVSLQMQFC